MEFVLISGLVLFWELQTLLETVWFLCSSIEVNLMLRKIRHHAIYMGGNLIHEITQIKFFFSGKDMEYVLCCINSYANRM